MANEKTKKELSPDLLDELEKADSLPDRIELLLIAILRELKGIKSK